MKRRIFISLAILLAIWIMSWLQDGQFVHAVLPKLSIFVIKNAGPLPSILLRHTSKFIHNKNQILCADCVNILLLLRTNEAINKFARQKTDPSSKSKVYHYIEIRSIARANIFLVVIHLNLENRIYLYRANFNGMIANYLIEPL